MSYGTGRPAILKDDESIWQCRLLLQHPLAIEDDMRLVSTVELMAIRERIHNNLAPLFDRPVDEHTFQVLRDADLEFRNWFATWDQAFSQKYEDAGKFYPLFLDGVRLEVTLDKLSTGKVCRYSTFTLSCSTMQRLCGASMGRRRSRRCRLPSAISLFARSR